MTRSHERAPTPSMSLRGAAAWLLAVLAGAAPADAQGSTQKILHPSGGSGDRFGQAVALQGDLSLVGAPWRDHSGASGAGDVSLFQRGGSGWQHIGTLIASTVHSYDAFGWSVAISGERILVGAPTNDDVATNAGGAQLFVRDPSGTWLHDPWLVAPNGQADDEFGTSVALDGDTAFVGAPYRDIGGQYNAGGVYVYEVDSSTGAWTFQQMLVPPTSWYSGEFGYSLATCGDLLFVGSPGDDGLANNAGAVHVFERGTSGWSHRQVLTGSATAAADAFGNSVACTDQRLVVGAPRENALTSDSGAAYVFQLAAGTWVETGRLTAFEARPDDFFGARVATYGDLVLVGGPGYDFPSGYDQGSAWLFQRSTWGWTLTAQLLAPDAATDDEFGRSVALWTDTALVGAHQDDDQGSNSGSAWVVDVLEDFLDTTPYCFCPAGTGPCGNDDRLAGCANVTGEGARLLGAGSSSVGADDLVLTATNLPALQNGLIYMGGGAAQLPFGAGLRCVVSAGAGIYRFPIHNSGATGTLSEGPGLAATAQAGFPANGWIEAGDTWFFQVWYRDALGPCATFNLSNAVAVEFGP